MPLYDLSTKAAWDNIYEVGAEGAWGHPNTRPEVQLHYHRFVMLPQDRINAHGIAAALGWDTTTRVVVVGCGFGWVLEVLQNELGLTKAVGVEVSQYIQGAKGTNEDDDVRAAIQAVGLDTTQGDGLTLFTALRGDGGPRAKKAVDVGNEDIHSNQGRSNIRSRVGGQGCEGLTYDLLTVLTDAECLQLSDAGHRLTSGRINHFVSVAPMDPPWNAKTLEEWKLLLPDDTFIETGTFRVL